MPKKPPLPALADQTRFVAVKPKPERGFDLASLKAAKPPKRPSVGMKRQMLPGKAGQR
jgi:hypothetical protein